MVESEEELKSLLMKVKEKSAKAGLKLNVQKTKIMASGPITSWQIDRETTETVTDFTLGGSKITNKPLDESGERKSWLKAQRSENKDHGIRSHHFMGNRWGNSGNSVRLYFLGGSKITIDGDCSHEIKRCLLLGRKVMTNVDSMLKSTDITFSTKFSSVQFSRSTMSDSETP